MFIAFFRTIILYAVVVFAMRIMGKRQIGELQPSEFVVAIMISELAAIPMQATGIPLVSGIVPIVTLMAAEVGLSYLAMKNRKCRQILSGKPSVLIRDGQVDITEMRRLRFNLDDLFEELRLNQCPNISDVQLGILETNGKLSILLKGERQTVTLSDMGLQPNAVGMLSIVITDGTIDRNALHNAGYDEQWLQEKLKQYNIVSLGKVFLAAVDGIGNLSFQINERQGDK